MLAAQAQAMSYGWPTDTLAFAEDFVVGSLPQCGTTSTTMPATRQIAGTSAAAAVTSPAFWPQMIADPPMSQWNSTQAFLFMHARCARPGSPERLVVFTTTLDADSEKRRDVRWTTYAISQRYGRGVQQRASNGILLDLPQTVRMRNEPVPPLRFFAGQPDPGDASRLTIRYELGAAKGTITARLLSDDRVELAADGPLSTFVH